MRVKRGVTATGSNPRESATETIPLRIPRSKGERSEVRAHSQSR